MEFSRFAGPSLADWGVGCWTANVVVTSLTFKTCVADIHHPVAGVAGERVRIPARVGAALVAVYVGGDRLGILRTLDGFADFAKFPKKPHRLPETLGAANIAELSP